MKTAEEMRKTDVDLGAQVDQYLRAVEPLLIETAARGETKKRIFPPKALMQAVTARLSSLGYAVTAGDGESLVVDWSEHQP